MTLYYVQRFTTTMEYIAVEAPSKGAALRAVEQEPCFPNESKFCRSRDEVVEAPASDTNHPDVIVEDEE